MENYDYYDENYFQCGATKGTAYNNYLTVSRSSKIYAEYADLIASVFKPKRALEVGCATGIIVKRLNDAGYEAFGVDVSSWAIENREHDNVILAGAEALPYPDGFFDFVYSVHALEHLPEALKSRAFAELQRVSSKNAIQFHTLPMIGSGPYKGDPDAVRAGLKNDPTHNLLFDKAWWEAEFAAIGFTPCGHALFRNDHELVDLGDSQLLSSNQDLDPSVAAALREWNVRVVATILQENNRLRISGSHPERLADSYFRSSLHLSGPWADLHLTPTDLSLTAPHWISGIVNLKSDGPILLRFCFISGEGADRFEGDWLHRFNPGQTPFSLSSDDLMHRIGTPRAPIDKIVFGGPGIGDVELGFAIADERGNIVELIQQLA